MARTYGFTTLLLQLLAITGVKSDCYNRNGTSVRDTMSFDNDNNTEIVSCGKGTNNCCLRGDQCGTNLLCKSIDGPNGGYLKRQFCEDIYWNRCSKAVPETKDSGYVLNNCLNSVFTLNEHNCSTGPFIFIDPLDGSVTSMSTSSGTTATASYWPVDTAAVLASQSAASISASLATSTGASSTPASSAPSATSTSSVPSQTGLTSSSSGLSAGAGAGLGVGAAAAIALVAGLAWLWIRERKKRRMLQGPAQPSSAPVTSEYSPCPEIDTHKVVYAQHHGPTEQYPPQELDHNPPVNELP